MTIEEMERDIYRYCDDVDYCEDCPLSECIEKDGFCWNYKVCENGEAKLKEHYEILFSKHDEANEPDETATTDNVNHPSHYNNGGMECIDEMLLIFGVEATMNFCLLNAWKYRTRCLYKNGEEDLSKSHAYLKCYKSLKEKGIAEF